MKKELLGGIVFVVLVVSVWVGYSFYLSYQPKEVVFQGEIDAQTYSLSSKIPGRIGRVFVKKGDMVKVGDKVFSIISPEIEAKLHQAQAAKDAANAQKTQADNGARKQEIQAAYDQYKKAKAAQELMQKTYTRIDKLYNDGVISQQKRDEVYTKYIASKYTKSAAKQLWVMAKEGAREEIKKAADAQERVYAAKVDEVNAFVKETLIHSFYDAEVSSVLIKDGELAPAGFPVVGVTDIKQAWAKFAIREDYLKYIKKGKVFHLKIPALSDKSYDFRVKHISVMGDFATFKSSQSSKEFDLKSFEVEFEPLNPIKDLRVGMSVLLSL